MENYQTQFRDFDISWYTKNKTKSFLKKLGTSFGFVIILMPIFGIILSIGNATKLSLLTNIGSILFSNIGIWFALAIIIGFTSNKGVAVYCGILSYLVFNVFIWASIKNNDNKNLFNIWFWHDLQRNLYLSKLFFGGLETFNSGIIGGILVGSYVTFIYKKFKDINLPKGLEFFAKERFVIILSVLFSIIAACLFIIIWPIFGFLLSMIGSIVAKSPIGLDAFIFRTIQRMLIPFGSNLLWQSPMWYTQVGGDLNSYQQDLLIQYLLRVTESENLSIINELLNINQKGFGQDEITKIFQNNLNNADFAKIEENINFWFKETESIFATNPSGDQIIWNIVSNNKYITVDDCWNVGLRVSRFISGGYINSIFILPTLSLTLLLMTPKGEKRSKMGIYITAALTAMLVGVTEPVEYLFCYTMPLFYFVIYCPLNGLLAMLTSLFKVKLGTSFSTGLFDFILSGVVPTANGVNTRIWIIPIIGIIASIFIFTIAFFWFKKFNKEENIINIEAKLLRDSIYILIDDFGGLKNIALYQLTQKELIIKFKNNNNVSNLFEHFQKIERTNESTIFTINESNKEKVEVLSFIIANRNNKTKFKKELK
ncbi:PTS transporter subunit EIIC [Spiroplasma cantharicola]|uniref:PTS system, glucose-specific IIBC component n=1 Tax=Spiroplasma cantharicola TaxID=362837 RepID=A0A0M4KEH3_9MOLU|nr:PTS transporter subunit EIIC [Spiroplasma cantharicola]ALD66395.1 PTS system, glucose-specific IIBC component [Spiroplasma cantharicola]